jgi:hypothetical protein
MPGAPTRIRPESHPRPAFVEERSDTNVDALRRALKAMALEQHEGEINPREMGDQGSTA